jgi:hypothetical protein
MSLSAVAKLIKNRYDNSRHLAGKMNNEPDFYRAAILYGGYGAMCEYPDTYDRLINELKKVFGK